MKTFEEYSYKLILENIDELNKNLLEVINKRFIKTKNSLNSGECGSVAKFVVNHSYNTSVYGICQYLNYGNFIGYGLVHIVYSFDDILFGDGRGILKPKDEILKEWSKDAILENVKLTRNDNDWYCKKFNDSISADYLYNKLYKDYLSISQKFNIKI